MAQVKKTIEIEAIAKDALQQIQSLTSKVEGLEKSLADAGKETKKTNKILGTMSNLFKGGLGILAIQKAFDLLKETFSSNQKVVDIFRTSTEALSLAFNDLFNFLDSNVGTVIQYFKDLFETPIPSIYDIGNALIDGVKKRFDEFVESLGYYADAFTKFFAGDFAGAFDSVKEGAIQSIDVLTGVDGTIEKVTETVSRAAKGITEYAKSTFEAAKQNVELQKTAELGIAQNRIILEQKDREAEKLRQIRDDESKTITERIEANNKLAAVLDEQERLMLANADAAIKAAQAQFDKNANDENQIALLEARAEREGILAQIEGFRSEQLMNVNSLNREKLDLLDEEKEKEIEVAELKKQLKEEEREGIKDNLDAIIDSAGEESAVGKALFIAKQGMLIKEQIMEAKATLAKVTMKAAESSTALATGTANTAKVGFPQNIPLLIAFAAQAAGIFSSIKSAVGAAKSSTSKFGGASGGGTSISAPSIQAATQAPAFNIVGASAESQLADTIAGQQERPVKAYVVSNDVSSQQALDRNIVKGASIG